MTQVLAALATHTLALVLYPGLVTLALLGAAAEVAWVRVAQGGVVLPDLRLRRPSLVPTAVALLSMLAAVQVAAPFNPVVSDERNVILAAVGLGFTLWAVLALGQDLLAEPGLLVVIQLCWLVAVLGPAVELQSLRPQVLGNVLVPALLPVKVAAAFLYVLCLPALLRLWPVPPPGERRVNPRFDSTRSLCWFPYCGLFATLFFPPPTDDIAGVARFFGITAAAAVLTIVAGVVMGRRGAAVVRGLYRRAVAPYAVLVVLLVAVTSLLVR